MADNDFREKQLASFVKRAASQLQWTEEGVLEELKNQPLGYNPSPTREGQLMVYLRKVNAKLIEQEDKEKRRQDHLYPTPAVGECPYHPGRKTQGAWWDHSIWHPIWECSIGGTLCYWLFKADTHRKTPSNVTLLQAYLATNPVQISAQGLAEFRESNNGTTNI